MKLAMYMGTSSLDVVHTHGLAALCRLMYSQRAVQSARGRMEVLLWSTRR